MTAQSSKYKLGTADTVLLAVGTLAVDYICTSKFEIVEVPPGGKKVYFTYEEFENKIQQYGIKKGKYYPGSSIGNFVTQAQEIALSGPSSGYVHLSTAMTPNDTTTAKIIIDSLEKKKIRYDITSFDIEGASNPVALLVENKGYTKILSYKDKRIPAIEVKTPKEGKPGGVVIGAAAGDGIQSKRNAFNYAMQNKLPIVMLTTENEVNQLAKNKAFKAVFDEIMREASFFAGNIDEVKKILLAENKKYSNITDKIKIAQYLREIYKNDKLDVLLSYGSEGSLVLVGNTVVIQKNPKVPYSDIVSTAGAGDALAGAFVQGVRMKGMDVEGVKWVLPRANRAAQNVLKYPDTKSGQFTAAQFLEEPPTEYETEIITL